MYFGVYDQLLYARKTEPIQGAIFLHLLTGILLLILYPHCQSPICISIRNQNHITFACNVYICLTCRSAVDGNCDNNRR